MMDSITKNVSFKASVWVSGQLQNFAQALTTYIPIQIYRMAQYQSYI